MLIYATQFNSIVQGIIKENEDEGGIYSRHGKQQVLMVVTKGRKNEGNPTIKEQ